MVRRKKESAPKFLGKNYQYVLHQFQNYLFRFDTAVSVVQNVKQIIMDKLMDKYQHEQVYIINHLLKAEGDGVVERAWKETIKEEGYGSQDNIKVSAIEFTERYFNILQDLMEG